MPKYSVIIPVYNVKKTIQRCIESLLNQPYEDFELILVDDCSSDGSLDTCKQYQSAGGKVIVLHQESNRGVSSARNRGLDSAIGEYVLFVDSDDFVAKNYFQTIDEFTGKYDLIEFGHFDYVTDSDGKTLEVKKSPLCSLTESGTELDWNNLLMKSFFASPCNKVFKRNLIGDLRFDEACVCYEDYLFNLHYCEKIHTFFVTDIPLYYYQQIQTVNHVSKRKWGKRFEISHKVADATLAFAEQHAKQDMKKYICCYPYGAFLIELRAAKANPMDYPIAKRELLRDEKFLEVTQAVYPKGKLISLLVFSMRRKLYSLGSIILEKLTR